MPTITFTHQNLKITVRAGSELLEVKRQNPDIPLKFGCMRGDCGVCAIPIRSGKANLTKMCPKEEKILKQKGLTSDYRLACQCALNGNIEI